MIAVLHFLDTYQTQILIGLGLIGLIYLFNLVRARNYLGATPYGLEREGAIRRQNFALGTLTLLVIVSVMVFLMHTVVATVDPPIQPTLTPLPTVTPSPVASGANLTVDSSGCDNPHATLTAPEPGERIAGSYEVKGTANIPNLAFYTFEISGQGTGGEWLSLGVGTEPKVDDTLGRFDSGARDTGEYAFRLVVTDNAGQSPPPCVIVVTLVSLTP